MKAPLIGAKFLIPAIVAVAVLSIGTMLMNAFHLPGWTYAGLIELILLTVTLIIFATSWSPAMVRYGILVYAVATGLQVVGQRYPALLGEFHFGTALGPYANNVGLLIGLPWFLSIMLSAQLSRKLVQNIYLGALIGTVLAMGVSLFMIYNGDTLQYFYWVEVMPPARAFIIWSVATFILLFGAAEMQIEFTNPASKALYVAWFGFHFLLFCFRFALG